MAQPSASSHVTAIAGSQRTNVERMTVADIPAGISNRTQASPTRQHRRMLSLPTRRHPPSVASLNTAALESGRDAVAALSSVVAETVRVIADLRTKRATVVEVARRNAVPAAVAVAAGAAALIGGITTFATAAAPVITLPFMFFVGFGFGTCGTIGAVSRDVWRAGWEIWDPNHVVLGAAMPAGCPALSASGPEGGPSGAGMAATGAGTSGVDVAFSGLVGQGRGASKVASLATKHTSATKSACVTKALSKRETESLRAVKKHQMLMSCRKDHRGVDYCQQQLKADAKLSRKSVYRCQQM